MSEIIKNRAELYDFEYPENFYGDLEYIHSYAKKHATSILELGAGTGRVGFSLLSKGFKITMVDNDRDMINFMLRKIDCNFAKESKKKLKIVYDSMVKYEKPNSFDLIIITGNSFTSLLTEEEQLKTLKNIKINLTNKGIAIIHVDMPSIDNESLNKFNFTYNFKASNREIVYHRYVMKEIDSKKKNLTFHFLYKTYKDSLQIGEFRNSAITKIVSQNDMKKLVNEAGMNIKAINDDFTDRPVKNGSFSVVYILNKN